MPKARPGRSLNACWQNCPEPVHYGAERLRVTISIGVALYPRHARNFTGLYKAADMALYRVKELGRSGSRVHGDDGELSEQACLELDVLKVPSGLASISLYSAAAPAR